MNNLLEPEALIEHFIANPPEGFRSLEIDGVPAFSTRFDLLTTIDARVRRAIDAVCPHAVRNLLRRPAVFVGTTTSEFALLPAGDGDRFVEHALAFATHHEFVIIKDLPMDPVLVGEESCRTSQQAMNAARERGFVPVAGQALAYVPIDFASIDEFLSRRSASRRKNLRRKLRSTSELDVEMVRTGDSRFTGAAFLQKLYALYMSVYLQSDIKFDLLTPEFFRAVLTDPRSHGVVFLYRAAAELIGFNLCFESRDMLIDKFIGFSYPLARKYNLYAVSWFRNLAYALERGLRFYVAGWTDPEVKRELGASFTMTQHAVFARNPVLRAALRALRAMFEADRMWERRAATAHS